MTLRYISLMVLCRGHPLLDQVEAPNMRFKKRDEQCFSTTNKRGHTA